MHYPENLVENALPAMDGIFLLSVVGCGGEQELIAGMGSFGFPEDLTKFIALPMKSGSVQFPKV